jgi:uncharacterized protein (TIGR02117 family)
VQSAVAAALAFVAGTVLYLLAAVVLTLVPVNTSWREPATGIEVFVYSNGFHTEFIVPVKTPVIDWRERARPEDFRRSIEGMTHACFGWGDREFFLFVQELTDLTPGIAVRALFWPTPTALRVAYEADPEPGPDQRRLVLTEEQYRALVAWIEASVQTGAGGRWLRLADPHDMDWLAFYEGAGSYGIFYTCNHWTNDILKRMGVRTGVWTPFAQGVMHHR